MDLRQRLAPFGQRRAERLGLGTDGRGVSQTLDFFLQGGRQSPFRVGGVVDELGQGVDETLHEDAAFKADEQRVRLERGLMQVLKRSFQWTDVFRVVAQQRASLFVS